MSTKTIACIHSLSVKMFIISRVDEFGDDDLLRARLSFMQAAQGRYARSIGSIHVQRFLTCNQTHRFP